MNHDYAHCLEFEDDCPENCFRAELSRDLKPGMIVSYMSFKNVCPKITRQIAIIPTKKTKIVQQVEITDECIDKIADAVVRRIKGEWSCAKPSNGKIS